MERPGQKTHRPGQKLISFAVEVWGWCMNSEWGECDTFIEIVCFADRQTMFDFLNYADQHRMVVKTKILDNYTAPIYTGAQEWKNPKIWGRGKFPQIKDLDHS